MIRNGRQENLNGKCPSSSKVLTGETINPYVKQIQYAVRGAIVQRAGILEKELAKVRYTVSFQVIAMCVCPELLETSNFPADAKAKARRILNETKGHSMGAYTDSQGIEGIRINVAKYISERDGHEADPSTIFLTGGASPGIKGILKLLQTGVNTGNGRAGVMIPIPQYPLYSATLSELNSYQINYYLDEANGWRLDIGELKRALNEARPHCVPRALCVINPGNPTGQVLPYENIQDIIKFCHEEELVLLADEVKHCIIMFQIPHSLFIVEVRLALKLVQGHSTFETNLTVCPSCGAYSRVALIQVNTVNSAITQQSICLLVFLQAMMDCLVSPPQPGDESYDTFLNEKTKVLQSLKERAKLVAETFNSMDGIQCNEVVGAMYAFPQVFIPRKAQEEAKARGMHPDSFYAIQLLEKTGLCVVPGNGFGQRDGTFHFRLTILPSIDTLKPLFEHFKAFHQDFMDKYRDDPNSSL
ncbi:PREDICTED: alanine aminotransferase 2-like [Acropora digitifera]|uniref:alanine aminotransferase 2-like n=1 Tax=Acropora digitifera TaxID=70779 RepID=UPI00077A376F|nr:PREDICTED: alanine aminotransferase 2-like [Acropora digitifera]